MSRKSALTQAYLGEYVIVHRGLRRLCAPGAMEGETISPLHASSIVMSAGYPIPVNGYDNRSLLIFRCGKTAESYGRDAAGDFL
jgi:hypothetical protein